MVNTLFLGNRIIGSIPIRDNNHLFIKKKNKISNKIKSKLAEIV